jgi:NADPH-dependent 2,4-dienoyl-CoA reductase/sulfur reductase-like enzyme/rhodanese-related sulfurtransferase
MKIVIVGGVAAGASTAARARRLNEKAEIIVLERGKHVSFANCGLPYHIGGVISDREELLLHTPQSLKASLNLDVRVCHEVISIDRLGHCVSVKDLETGREYSETYDKLVLCPGATPVRPPLPGLDHPAVLVLRNIDDMDRIKAGITAGAKKAVVIGGGYIGVETAENLRGRGLEVDLVEMLDQIMPTLDHEMTRDLESHMIQHGVRIHLGTAVSALHDVSGRVRVELNNGKSLNADMVILAAGVKPDSRLAKQAGLEIGPCGGIKVNDRMQTSDPDIYAAGDAVEVTSSVTGNPAVMPLAGPANRQGRIVADNMMGIPSSFAAAQGTAVVKVFDMTAGMTGATEKMLIKAGKAFRKIYIHPTSHAGYYPGATSMHVKMLFDPTDGRILGAQIAGFDGVDKRLDVFATAISGKMTVYDLESLELAYAPPYGSAKDPVNMAGFVAGNLLRGDVEFWYAEDYPGKTGGGLILDVRGPREFGDWHIPGATNIPLGKLRAGMNVLPKDKPIYVYCKVGFRSYLAYRILKQSGYTNVSTLAGGSATFRCYPMSQPQQ